jgi:hypothetical protein
MEQLRLKKLINDDNQNAVITKFNPIEATAATLH